MFHVEKHYILFHNNVYHFSHIHFPHISHFIYNEQREKERKKKPLDEITFRVFQMEKEKQAATEKKQKKTEKFPRRTFQLS